jgi:hypothetical protein
MLAYVFWHRPRLAVDRDAYEGAQRKFHARLEVPSASFRVDPLPFGDGGAGYEDWYLVEDWHGLGELNAAAVDARRRPHHDLAAAMAGAGWGGIYALLRGEFSPPARVSWVDRPAGEAVDDFVAAHNATAIWQRQMVLGPAPELCLSEPGGARLRIWPR